MATHAPITGAPSRAPITYDTIISFCHARGIPPTRFGRTVAGDPGLLAGIRAGRTLRPETLAKITTYMKDGVVAHQRRRASGKVRRHADDFATIAQRHRAMMQRGSERLLAAILREAGRA